MRRVDAILLLALALGGCAAAEPVSTPLEPAQLSYDLLDRRRVVLGPSLPLGAGTQRLRAWIAEDGAVTHHLLVSAAYRATGWHYYETATAAADGTALTMRSTDRRVGACAAMSWLGCDHAEDMEIALPEGLLTAAAPEALTIHVEGRDGSDMTVRLSPEQIRAQLSTVAAAR